ncbi:hypothetical protein [Arthrobacter sp. MYb227]|uniref:hypothetical protein n=1 Tax=Arthrobacter sp. MYb227 TaxID=1848601 RepID=UPI0011B03DC6|nr:hypothetical protein [Arthrobacter sp. MYb227]
MRDRIIWTILAVVLAAFALSLWQDSAVASLGSGAVALYAAFSTIRGRCFGDVCATAVNVPLEESEVRER